MRVIVAKDYIGIFSVIPFASHGIFMITDNQFISTLGADVVAVEGMWFVKDHFIIGGNEKGAQFFSENGTHVSALLSGGRQFAAPSRA